MWQILIWAKTAVRYDTANHYAWRLPKLKGALPEKLHHWALKDVSDCLKAYMTKRNFDIRLSTVERLLVLEDIQPNQQGGYAIKIKSCPWMMWAVRCLFKHLSKQAEVRFTISDPWKMKKQTNLPKREEGNFRGRGSGRGGFRPRGNGAGRASRGRGNDRGRMTGPQRNPYEQKSQGK